MHIYWVISEEYLAYTVGAHSEGFSHMFWLFSLNIPWVSTDYALGIA